MSPLVIFDTVTLINPVASAVVSVKQKYEPVTSSLPLSASSYYVFPIPVYSTVCGFKMYGADGRSVEARLDEIENHSQTVQAVPFAAKDGACHSSTLPKFDDLISPIAFVVPLGQTNITQGLEVQLVVGFFQINYVSNTAHLCVTVYVGVTS